MSRREKAFDTLWGEGLYIEQIEAEGWDILWRPSRAFIGPVEPPMVKWLREGGALAPRVVQLPMPTPLGHQLALAFGEPA